MKYFSMFSGIGGFELGIQNASNQQLTEVKQDRQGGNRNTDEVGHDVLSTSGIAPLCIGYSEIDKYATQVYEKHFKHKNYGDATKINPRELPDFDLLVGGFPCQAFSIAGKRKGFDDTRGTLFFDIARILAEKKPRLVVLENVKGLLSHEGGKTFQTIVGVLTDLGYFVEWQVLNSKNFGVPQNRERVFIIGHLRGEPRRKVFPIGENTESIVKQCDKKVQKGEIAQTITATYHKGEKGSQIVQLNQPTHSSDRVYGADGISPTLNTMQGGNTQPFISIKYGQNNPDRNGNTSPDMFTLKTGGANAGITDGIRIRRLTPTECERLQGFPDGWTEDLSDTQRYKCLGNAVTTNVITYLFSKLLNHEEENIL